MFDVIPRLIYQRMFEIIDTDPVFAYMRTRQKGFFPRSEDVLSPPLYPWCFIEFGSVSGIEVFRTPEVWTYEFTVAVVVMTIADRGDPTSLVFNDGTNTKKGVGDMVADIGNVFWGKYKRGGIGVDGVRDWNIVRVGTPSVLSVQALLINPFVRGLQMDFVFQVNERGGI